MKKFLALAALAAASTAQAGDSPAPTFSPDAFEAHVAFLADDLLEGRQTGSRGHEIAARYVAAQFAAAGLTPARHRRHLAAERPHARGAHRRRQRPRHDRPRPPSPTATGW